jgi:hypothetical protein
MLYNPGERLVVGAFPISTVNLVVSALILKQRCHLEGTDFAGGYFSA